MFRSFKTIIRDFLIYFLVELMMVLKDRNMLDYL